MNIDLKKFAVPLCALSIVSLQSCMDGSEATIADTEFNMKAVSGDNTSVNNGRSEGEIVAFSEIMVGVTAVEFEGYEEPELEDQDDIEGDGMDSDNENMDEVEFEGNYRVDLMNGTSNPEFGVVEMRSGTYQKMEVEMDPILEGGNTMWIVFDYMKSGSDEVKRVEYATNAELDFEFEHRDGGYTMEGDETSQMLVTLNVEALLEGVDFDNAEEDADGVIRINSTSNASLASIIEANVVSSLQGGEDEDGDGFLDLGAEIGIVIRL